MSNRSLISFYQMLGPGLLSAGAAIGVSHVVQSTRAGAEFGYALIVVVILANLFKYPFFRAAPIYTVAAGENLLQGYLRLGRWTLWLVLAMTIATMFTIQAAVTIVTSGLAIKVFGFAVDPKTMSFFVILFCGTLLVVGRYSFLDKMIKAVVILLTLTTIGSLLGSFSISKTESAFQVFDWGDRAHLFFLVGLAGWMPAPLDLSIWHSLWIDEKKKSSREKPDVRRFLLDFNIGYIGTALLAVAFLILGANVMYGSGVEFSDKAHIFAGQLISLYTVSLGDWAYWLIAIAALATMFSTTLTCLDAFPRVLKESSHGLFGVSRSPMGYRIGLVVVSLGTLLLLFFFISSMRQMVDIATTLSFVLTPVYAFMNYFLLRSEHMPVEFRPRGWGLVGYRVGLLALTVFSGWFLILKF